MGKLDRFYLELDEAIAKDVGQRAAEERFTKAAHEESLLVAERIRQAQLGNGGFTVYELLYAAWHKCLCGAGMAYPDDIGIHGAWYCSAILLGQAPAGTEHSPSLPFSMYSVKSEGSDGPATTRPAGTHIEIEPTYACYDCGNTGKGPRYRPGIDKRPSESIVCSNCGIKWLNEDGSSNSKLQTRWMQVVADDVV